MANPTFVTRDRRIIKVGKGQVKSDAMAGDLQTIRFMIQGKAGAVVTDMTPRETLVLASILLDTYRRTLPQEEDYRAVRNEVVNADPA